MFAPPSQKLLTLASASLVVLVVACVLIPFEASVQAFGEASAVDLRKVLLDDAREPRTGAARRLAWEVRKRTSVDTRLEPTQTRLDDPSVFTTPFLYLASDRGFGPPSEQVVSNLRRFVEFGGFVLIDDAAPDSGEFDRAVRALLARAFPRQPLAPLAATHTVFHSFYLISRPLGRVLGPSVLEAIRSAGRVAIVYSRHDLGGAWARDDLGQALYPVVPGGDTQREQAVRLGVNLVMYALCLDYKDDQVHAPFLLRRRGGGP